MKKKAFCHYIKDATLFTEYSGELTLTQVTNARTEAAQMLIQAGVDKHIVDMTDVTDVDITTTEITNLAKAKTLPLGITRVYVAQRPLVYGLLRMFQTHASMQGGDSVAVTKSKADAIALLQKPEVALPS